MLVTRVIGDCPGCKAKSCYGNVSVQGDCVVRGCLICNYNTTIPLPPIEKKILYVDQFFFSSAFRAKDPRFVKAAERIRQIAALQLLAVPYSSIHEDETNQWRGYSGRCKEDLMEFIKATSRGHEFKPAYRVEKRQTIRAFQSFLSGGPSTFDIEERDVVDEDIHEWEDYFRIDVGGRYWRDIELQRELKQQSVEELVDLFPSWRQSKNPFDEDVALEMRDGAKAYIQAYNDMPPVSHVVTCSMPYSSRPLSRRLSNPFLSAFPRKCLSNRDSTKWACFFVLRTFQKYLVNGFRPESTQPCGIWLLSSL